jgi:hypothetical protein
MANGYENVDDTQVVQGNVMECTVYPKHPADPTSDRAAVEFAINRVGKGGTVVLKPHRRNEINVTPFDFGGDSVDNAIYLAKPGLDVTIKGERVAGVQPECNDPIAGVAENGGATIVGGRVPFVVGINSAGVQTQVTVKIVDIRFRNFYRAAIRVFATKGQNLISGCSFVNYDQSNVGVGPDDPQGAWPIVADNAAAPDNLAGQLTITGNFFGPPLAAGPMNNLLHVSFCNLTPFTFSNNRITDMRWLGIVVYANKGETIISRNRITKNSSFLLEGAGISVGAWPAISPTDPPEGKTITIDSNIVEVASLNSNGIQVFLMDGKYYNPKAPDGRKIVVRDNTVNMVGGGVQERAAMACLGACSKSEWVNNTVKGEAPYGIWVSDHASMQIAGNPVLAPSDNTFRNNSLESFTATKSQAFIGATVEHLKLLDNAFGAVSNSNPHKPPLDDAVADIRCKGHLSEISGNNFQHSGLKGWETPPQWLGCIYLDSESNQIQVKYHDSDFPPVPLIAKEIYNAGKQNHIERLGP